MTKRDSHFYKRTRRQMNLTDRLTINLHKIRLKSPKLSHSTPLLIKKRKNPWNQSPRQVTRSKLMITWDTSLKAPPIIRLKLRHSLKEKLRLRHSLRLKLRLSKRLTLRGSTRRRIIQMFLLKKTRKRKRS